MLSIGVDVHKKTLTVCVMGESGEVLLTRRIPNELEVLDAFFGEYAGTARVAMEPTHNWGLIYDLVRQKGIECLVCDPRQTRLIGKALVKTDRLDARRLAMLLRADMLPLCYVAEPDVRSLRDLVRARASLVRVTVLLKNQIQVQMGRLWVRHSFTDLFGKGGRAFLEGLPFSPQDRRVLQMRLELIDETKERIALLNEEVRQQAEQDMRAQLLMTVPGIAHYSALVVLAEIGDISRFPRAESLVSYAGICQKESSSGESIRRGSITKAGSRWLRWILVEAALHTIRHEGKIRDLYLRVSQKKGHNVAIVAAARELLVSIYWVLKRMEPFHLDGRSKSVAGTV